MNIVIKQVLSDVELTEKQVQMVKLLADGLRSKDIGQILDVSNRTVEMHLDGLRRKTGCKTLPHLVAHFLRNKIIE